MIDGFFGTDGHAYLRGRVYLPRLGAGGYVYFLIDTGADATTLHPDDGRKIGCAFDELVNPIRVGGVGGYETYYDEPASITFSGIDGYYGFEIDLSVGKPSEESDGLESLLGVDILNRMRMDYDFRRGRVRFDEVEADWGWG